MAIGASGDTSVPRFRARREAAAAAAAAAATAAAASAASAVAEPVIAAETETATQTETETAVVAAAEVPSAASSASGASGASSAPSVSATQAARAARRQWDAWPSDLALFRLIQREHEREAAIAEAPAMLEHAAWLAEVSADPLRGPVLRAIFDGMRAAASSGDPVVCVSLAIARTAATESAPSVWSVRSVTAGEDAAPLATSGSSGDSAAPSFVAWAQSVARDVDRIRSRGRPEGRSLARNASGWLTLVRLRSVADGAASVTFKRRAAANVEFERLGAPADVVGEDGAPCDVLDFVLTITP